MNPLLLLLFPALAYANPIMIGMSPFSMIAFLFGTIFVEIGVFYALFRARLTRLVFVTLVLANILSYIPLGIVSFLLSGWAWWMIVLEVPIVLIEARMIHENKFTWKESLGASLLMNAVSFGLGFFV